MYSTGWVAHNIEWVTYKLYGITQGGFCCVIRSGLSCKGFNAHTEQQHLTAATASVRVSYAGGSPAGTASVCISNAGASPADTASVCVINAGGSPAASASVRSRK
jgi:hypothetical protein